MKEIPNFQTMLICRYNLCVAFSHNETSQGGSIIFLKLISLLPLGNLISTPLLILSQLYDKALSRLSSSDPLDASDRLLIGFPVFIPTHHLPASRESFYKIINKIVISLCETIVDQKYENILIPGILHLIFFLLEAFRIFFLYCILTQWSSKSRNLFLQL